MAMVSAQVPSASQVDKAGSRIRKAIRGEDIDQELVDRSVDVLYAWRAAHARPLASASMGLRSMVNTAGCTAEISQRLKRVPTIFDKLIREPTLALSRMQDVGGVRAVLRSVAEIQAVEKRIRMRRPVRGYSDYITAPRQSGYRGVHIIVEYGGRNIEIQLRTYVMHEWAITVERIGARLGTNLKQDGRHAIQLLMRAISEAMAIEESGGIVDEAMQDEIGMLREGAAPYLARPWRG
ncbi:MAG: RelA/SpoT domain-containing protein [Jatrophihabitans sp.]|uniref:RelA/SpoT domain-containing protein n=1 Tax=Jatrophihabitans sp. TaxID=1932789 RepID=UPI003F7E76B5